MKREDFLHLFKVNNFDIIDDAYISVPDRWEDNIIYFNTYINNKILSSYRFNKITIMDEKPDQITIYHKFGGSGTLWLDQIDDIKIYNFERDD